MADTPETPDRRGYWLKVIRLMLIRLGIFWKRMNRDGAIASMLTGLILIFACILHIKPGAGKAAMAEDWFPGTSPRITGFPALAVPMALRTQAWRR